MEWEALRVGVGAVGEGGIAVLRLEVAAVRTADVGIDDRHQLRTFRATHQFVGESRVAQIQMAGMDHRGRRLAAPQVGDRQGEDAQHAPGALEALDRGELLGEVIDQGRVKGIVGGQTLPIALLSGLFGQQQGGAPVHLHVGIGSDRGAARVDSGEQASRQHARDFLTTDGDDRGGVALDDASHLAVRGAGDPECLVLRHVLAVGLGDQVQDHRGLAGEGVALTGQGQDDGEPRMLLGILEERHQEGRHAGASARPGRLDTGGVGGQLIEHDQDFAALEDHVEILVPGGAERAGGGADGLVGVFAADLEGDLAPQGIGDQARTMGLVNGHPVACDADHRDFARGEQQGGIDRRPGPHRQSPCPGMPGGLPRSGCASCRPRRRSPDVGSPGRSRPCRRAARSSCAEPGAFPRSDRSPRRRKPAGPCRCSGPHPDRPGNGRSPASGWR